MSRLSRGCFTSWVAIMALLLIPARLSSAQTSSSKPAGSSFSSDRLLIGSGDVLSVQVFDTPELSGQMRVADDGTISLPAGGAVKVAGLTTVQAAAAVQLELKSQEIMLDPHVTITIAEFATQGITVAGEVKSPGIYTLLGAHNLYDILSAAGGPTPYEGPTITITHKNDPEHPVVLDVHSVSFSDTLSHTRVYPGDTVFVSRAGLIYVLGAVGHSGAFVMQDGEKMTILTTLALAQGPSATAALSKAEIIRHNPQGIVEIQFDLKKVMKHKSPDLALSSGDILVIPGSGLKDFTMKTLPGMTTGAANAASYSLIYQ